MRKRLKLIFSAFFLHFFAISPDMALDATDKANWVNNTCIGDNVAIYLTHITIQINFNLFLIKFQLPRLIFKFILRDFSLYIFIFIVTNFSILYIVFLNFSNAIV